MITTVDADDFQNISLDLQIQIPLSSKLPVPLLRTDVVACSTSMVQFLQFDEG